ncbi:hypothetical protein IEQ34_020342 [Dendrobium chrysotoxum]|uniref:Uncharacterized protein n=1 Tax=Dendrobium chrysotoxum TaxID=161865 RepID=A0AAV7G0M9_DENCH|nr:hypothetical protein IEQ34_020342 [Dendrobium chrysotoxum]
MRSNSGTRPLAEKTSMKATSCSSITRRDPITPPIMLWVFTASEELGGGVGGTERGATASERPDIF